MCFGAATGGVSIREDCVVRCWARALLHFMQGLDLPTLPELFYISSEIFNQNPSKLEPAHRNGAEKTTNAFDGDNRHHSR